MSTCKIDFIDNWDLKYQGAESRIYFGLHSNKRCVIKHRFSKKYRHPILDKKLTKERTKRERRMIEKISSKSKTLAPYMPKVVWSDDSTILMTELINGQTLHSLIEDDKDLIKHNLAKLIGQCVAELHNLGIIHGDLTTSNLIMMPRQEPLESQESGVGHSDDHEAPTKKVKSQCILGSHIVIPIDFGLATGSLHTEERAVDLYVLERALLSTHFPDSGFFNLVLDAYIEALDESTCESRDKRKIIDRLREVRARGRKSEYIGE